MLESTNPHPSPTVQVKLSTTGSLFSTKSSMMLISFNPKPTTTGMVTKVDPSSTWLTSTLTGSMRFHSQDNPFQDSEEFPDKSSSLDFWLPDKPEELITLLKLRLLAELLKKSETVRDKSKLIILKFRLGGVMLWDSHWDQANGYAISNKALESIE